MAVAPVRKRSRVSKQGASTASTADGSETSDPENTVRLRSASDGYDVCKAIEEYANQRPGDSSEQRREDLQDEIALKRKQAASLAQMLDSAKPLSDAQRSHYTLVRRQLLSEIKCKKAELEELSGPGVRACLLDGEIGPCAVKHREAGSEIHREPNKRGGERSGTEQRAATLLAKRIAKLASQRATGEQGWDLQQARRLARKHEKFHMATNTERNLQAERLETQVESALRRVDAGMACQLVHKVAACLTAPAARPAENADPLNFENSERYVQRRLRRALFRLLQLLDLSDVGTKDLVRCPCAHILALVEDFQVHVGGLDVADCGRQWENLKRVAEAG